MTEIPEVKPESDVATVIEGLEYDVGGYLKRVERYGQGRLEITGQCRGVNDFPRRVLDYMAIAGWNVDDLEIDPDGDIKVNFVRGREIKTIAQNREYDFDTLDLLSGHQ